LMVRKGNAQDWENFRLPFRGFRTKNTRREKSEETHRQERKSEGKMKLSAVRTSPAVITTKPERGLQRVPCQEGKRGGHGKFGELPVDGCQSTGVWIEKSGGDCRQKGRLMVLAGAAPGQRKEVLGKEGAKHQATSDRRTGGKKSLYQRGVTYAAESVDSKRKAICRRGKKCIKSKKGNRRKEEMSRESKRGYVVSEGRVLRTGKCSRG